MHVDGSRMTQDLISKKTRNEFREYFVGSTLREIEQEFDSADIKCDLEFVPSVSGQRRYLIEQYYHSINWADWNDVRNVLRLYENALAYLEEQAKPANNSDKSEKWATKPFLSLKRWIERDGFEYKNGRLTPIGNGLQIASVAKVAKKLDAPELHRQIDRMMTAVESDPCLAIGTAKELVETTCKTILEDHNVEVDSEWDIGRLVKETRKVLGLLPDQIPQSAKGAESIRKLLSSLAALAQGLGELRNLYGTGHGRSGSSRGLASRHARLCVGAASTLATFLFETHEERSMENHRGKFVNDA